MSSYRPVVFASDEMYSSLVACAIVSIADHLPNPEGLQVFVICERIQQATKDRLKRVCDDRKLEISFVEMPDLNQVAGVALNFRNFSMSTFARLYLASVLPTLDDVLYLDCDILAVDSIELLLQTSIDPDCAAMGVLDAASAHNKGLIGLGPQEPYVNAGVLLLNLAAWRRLGLEMVFTAYVQKHGGTVPHNDQGVLNACLRGLIQPIDCRFNVMTYHQLLSWNEVLLYKRPSSWIARDQYESARECPAILHATGSFLCDRPWVEGSTSPMRSRWLDAASRTGLGAEKESTLPRRQPSIPVRILRGICDTPLRRTALWLLGFVQATIRDRLPSF